MKKTLVTFLLLITALSSFAKVLSVKIGVNGLTCPMCTRSVELEIRKLSFVKDVEMNLEHTEGLITFKDDGPVNFHKIAKAVVDAGFTVRYLSAEIKLDAEELVSADVCYTIDKSVFNFAELKKAAVGATVNLLFIGKAYQEKQEFQKWKAKIRPVCKSESGKDVYTVAML
ncbi:MAG: heavy-metal-associated domain-containing protein [Bacteroidia bacterium]